MQTRKQQDEQKKFHDRPIRTKHQTVHAQKSFIHYFQTTWLQGDAIIYLGCGEYSCFNQ